MSYRMNIKYSKIETHERKSGYIRTKAACNMTIYLIYMFYLFMKMKSLPVNYNLKYDI